MTDASKRDEKLNLTSMIDIAFLIVIFFMCLPFQTLAFKLESHLPKYKGIEAPPQPPKETFEIAVRILGRKEKPREWRGRRVPAPTEVRYRFADGRSTDDIWTVGAHIRRMRREAVAADAKAVGRIHASARIPQKHVIAMLNQFADAGVKDVELQGTKFPSKRALLANGLPYPK